MRKRFNKFSPLNYRKKIDQEETNKKFELKAKRGELKIPFGKYRGSTIKEVYELDPGYLSWLSTTDFRQRWGLILFLEFKKFKDLKSLSIEKPDLDELMPL